MPPGLLHVLLHRPNFALRRCIHADGLTRHHLVGGRGRVSLESIANPTDRLDHVCSAAHLLS